MGDLVAIFNLVKGLSTEITTVIAVLIFAFAFWFKRKDVDITAATSVGKLQQDALNVLMKQNKELSDSLDSLRTKMSETYTVIDEMRKKIMELEDLVRMYQNGCDNCPGFPDAKKHIKIHEIIEFQNTKQRGG